jgi:hypothetical protein
MYRLINLTYRTGSPDNVVCAVQDTDDLDRDAGGIERIPMALSQRERAMLESIVSRVLGDKDQEITRMRQERANARALREA